MRGKESKSWWRRFVDGVTRLFFYKKKAVVKRKSSSFGISSTAESEIIPDEATKKIFEEKKQRTTQILLEKLSKKDLKKPKVEKKEELSHQTPLKTAVIKMSSSAPLEKH